MKSLPCGPKVFCLFSIAVMNAITKNNSGRDWFISSHSLQFIPKKG